jgi:hypothetical protein
VVASKWAKVVAGAGSVKSSAGTYTACTEVIEPFLVVVIRSCLEANEVGSQKPSDIDSHLTHVCRECRLVTDSRGNTTEKSGHLGAGLGEAENVVDEQ